MFQKYISLRTRVNVWLLSFYTLTTYLSYELVCSRGRVKDPVMPQGSLVWGQTSAWWLCIAPTSAAWWVLKLSSSHWQVPRLQRSLEFRVLEALHQVRLSLHLLAVVLKSVVPIFSSLAVREMTFAIITIKEPTKRSRRCVVRKREDKKKTPFLTRSKFKHGAILGPNVTEREQKIFYTFYSNLIIQLGTC